MGKMTDALRKARLLKERKDTGETPAKEEPGPTETPARPEAQAQTPPHATEERPTIPASPSETVTTPEPVSVPPETEPEPVEPQVMLPDVETGPEDETAVDDRAVYLAGYLDKEGPVAEEFRSLRGRLTKELPSVRVILITSCAPGDGKTTLALNMATSFTGSFEEKVVLVDANLPRPRLGKVLEAGEEGLIQVAAGQAAAESAAVKTEVPGLWAVPLGERGERSEGVLESKASVALLKALKRRFTRVLVELPAWDDLEEPPAMLEQADVVLVPVRRKHTRRRDLRRLLDALKKAGVGQVRCVFMKS